MRVAQFPNNTQRPALAEQIEQVVDRRGVALHWHVEPFRDELEQTILGVNFGDFLGKLSAGIALGEAQSPPFKKIDLLRVETKQKTKGKTYIVRCVYLCCTQRYMQDSTFFIARYCVHSE